MLAPNGTAVNIAISDSKDFPLEVVHAGELFSEFCMLDGRVLFECQQLTKASGIDLVNCPLNVVLKLRVRRRQPGNVNPVLYHVVLPLPIVSRYLLSAPFEWETWLGLFPGTHNLDDVAPETGFTQAVAAVNHAQFPKLRLKFTYHNPQLAQQLEAQRAREEEEKRRREEQKQQVGSHLFEELQLSLSQSTRAVQAAAPLIPGPATALPTVAVEAQPVRQQREHTPVAQDFARQQTPVAQDFAQQPTPPEPSTPGGGMASREDFGPAAGEVSSECLRETLLGTTRFINEVSEFVGITASGLGGLSEPLPAPLDVQQVLASGAPAAAVEAHCQRLSRSLQALGSQFLAAQAQSNGSRGDTVSLVVEGLRMSLFGMLESGPTDGGTGMPRTITNLSEATNTTVDEIRQRHPALWDALREVSVMANERAALIENQQERKAEHEGVTEAETRRHFERLLAQQRRALQVDFDAETERLRKQVGEAQGAVIARDQELAWLRREFEEARRITMVSPTGTGR